MRKTTIELDEYERANLLWLLRAVGYPYQANDCVEPFSCANTGDWVGQIATKARYNDPPEVKPNISIDELRSSVNRRVNVPDRLQQMWDQQHSFMKLLQEKRSWPEFPTDISSKSGQKFLKDITHHVMDELFEAGQHLKNAKSHRATLIPEVDREAYKEELVDALHLFLELVIVSGINLEEVFLAYMAKGQVNFDRINSGY